jgi:hypothetical protein
VIVRLENEIFVQHGTPVDQVPPRRFRKVKLSAGGTWPLSSALSAKKEHERNCTNTEGSGANYCWNPVCVYGFYPDCESLANQICKSRYSKFTY